MAEQHDRILGYFLEEAGEHLITIEQGLRKLPETVKQPTTIRELFRAAHSIKGSAAMLGLLDIQKISNQFEANFKLLKEQPEIAVDTQLQSLFLESFSFLQAGIDEVRRSSDPYRQDPATPDAIGDPVFEELKSYLQHLVAHLNPAVRAPATREQRIERDPAIEQVFGEYVTRKLDEIISLCLQADRPEIRTQIQQLCQKLGNIGENFEFLEWTNLFAACRLAIANPANSLPRLGESISIAVKQAQVLVLADRHQSIGITPELEASIGYKRSASDIAAPPPIAEDLSSWKLDTYSSAPVNEDLSTSKLDTYGSAPIVSLDLEATTDKLERASELLSLGGSQEASINNEDRPFDFDLIAVTDTELNQDAMELNEFMNSLSDDMPSEGTWIQDEDFFNRELLSQDTSSLTTDKFEPPIFDPAADLAEAIYQVNPGANEGQYDEETFYTPDLEDIDDRDIANFWADTQLVAAQQQIPFAIALLGDDDSQLQPVLSLAADLVDIPAPDFGLDRSINELFPTAMTPPVDWSELEQSEVISGAMVAPVDGTDVELGLDIAAVETPFVVHSAAIETPVESSDLHLDLQIPTHPLDDSLFAEVASAQMESIDLEPDNTPDLSHHTHDSSDPIDRAILPNSDVLMLEDLNGDRPEATDVTDDLSTAPLPSQIDAQLSNWIDNSIEDAVENLADFDIDVLDGGQPGDILAVDDDFAGFDLDFLNGSEPIADLSDLEVASVHNPQGSSSIIDDFTDLDLNPLDSQSLDLNSSAMDDVPDLNSNSIDNNDLEDALHPDLHVLDEHLVGESGENSFTEVHSIDLDLNEFSDLNLDDLAADESSEPLSNELEFSDLGLNVKNIDELGLNAADAHIITDLSLDLDLEMLGISEPTLAISTDSDLAALNFTSLTDIKPNTSAHTDLDIADRHNAAFEAIDSSDFANLDIDFGSENSFASNGASFSELEHPSELDFNLDEIGANLSSHELTDLESMLGDSSLESLSENGSSLTNAEDLDALLGIAALGVGGAAIAGGELAFADLDALVDPTSAAEPVDSLDELDRLLEAPAPVANPPAPKTDKKSTDRRAKQSRTFEQTMRVSVRHLDNLNNLVGELVVNRNTLEQDQNRMRQFVEKLLSEVQKLNEVGKRMQDLYERSLMENSLVASRQQYKPAPATPNNPISGEDLGNDGTLMEYDPLEMDRFTPIHLLSQKMIELTVRVRESTADIEFVVDGSTEVTRTLRQITGQLQEDLTKSRMVPFAQTADRLQRGVRDNGLKYGKQIELNVEGRDTPIDKVILESLTEPLIHMVNNAIAHGIESTEARQAAGKPNEGKITIRALHQGNQTIISISDDGAGIDTERVKNKAIEKGVITAGQASTMSKAEIYELLFLPSFSTKDQADELSGRGVGMDVVRTSITEIRGTITTESQLGVGTTFTIRLPLALSIAKALIAVNNKSNIAFPMDGIEDTQDVSPEQIQTNSEGEQCIFWRDRLMPFKPLSDLLAFNRPLARNNFYATNEDDTDLVSILILRSDGNLIAIQVDKITGDQEIVIKPLQGPAAKPLGIAGATVLGDGRIIPIADVMELIALANGTLSRHVSTQWTDKIATPTVELRESMVLIVDDSITVRELLSLTFKRAGYRVEQARDGQEAWDKLRAGLPCDIVFCDIEMPRMDGLEFLSRIQKDVALSKVPIAMLTSRGSDRHRQIASQLGASGYFIKPYLEEALLDAAKRMIKGEVLEIV